MSRLLLVAYFLEVGFVLTLAPWTTFWDRNYFADMLPLLQPVLANNFVRGAVTGVGLITTGAGLVDLAILVVERVHARQSSRPADEPQV